MKYQMRIRYSFVRNGQIHSGVIEMYYNQRGWLEMRDWLIPQHDTSSRPDGLDWLARDPLERAEKPQETPTDESAH